MCRYAIPIVTSILVLSLTLAKPVSAQTAPDVNDRLANQADRISSGIRDGSLNAGETARLQRQQAHISREEARFKSDGRFTPAERRHVVRDENRASRHIYRQRHDAQRRC